MTKKCGNDEKKLQAKENYKERKKELRKLIVISKREHWHKLCNELNNDVWGEGYRIVVKGVKHLVPYDIPLSSKGTFYRIVVKGVKHLVPYDIPLSEKKKATYNIKTGKAPGMDAIPPEAIKETAKTNGQWLLQVMNGLLKVQRFPVEWKAAKVLLIPKEVKLGKPKVYRPL
ncbi:hypothetical protein QE152_g15719 [Popillia japonica]|uniref:Reverse transcriptase n=1 Tax=Popillia japonica TaxID=7064 RepID=A0AAW1L649_POPJA